VVSLRLLLDLRYHDISSQINVLRLLIAKLINVRFVIETLRGISNFYWKWRWHWM